MVNTYAKFFVIVKGLKLLPVPVMSICAVPGPPPSLPALICCQVMEMAPSAPTVGSPAEMAASIEDAILIGPASTPTPQGWLAERKTLTGPWLLGWMLEALTPKPFSVTPLAPLMSRTKPCAFAKAAKESNERVVVLKSMMRN